MYVRLAFAVAAHLESEILIVDEVLAVGDAEFQKKCLGKMGDISKGEGRTVLFVSHNMAAVQNLCSKGILLENGMMKYDGEIGFVVNKYLENKSELTEFINNSKKVNEPSEIILLSKGNNFSIESNIEFEIKGITDKEILTIGVAILDKFKNKVFTTFYKLKSKDKYCIKFIIPKKTLCPGFYSIDVATFVSIQDIIFYVNDICPFQIIDTGSDNYLDSNYGNVYVNCLWYEL
jgi:lipopolysaccharide transport system ATP-binding protein